MDKDNYLDNKKFLEELRKYRKEYMENPDDPPIPSDYIGRCIMLLAKNIASRPNFSGYTYIDEMISDGILNASKALHKFDPEVSNNPFGYFTTVIWRSFLQRIETEKKESYKKHASLRQYHIESIIDPEFGRHIVDTLDDEGAAELERKFGKGK